MCVASNAALGVLELGPSGAGRYVRLILDLRLPNGKPRDALPASRRWRVRGLKATARGGDSGADGFEDAGVGA